MLKSNITVKLLGTLTACVLLISSCKNDNVENYESLTTRKYDGELATVWMDQYRELVKSTAGYTPPVAARAFGYAGLTMYESAVHGMPGYQSLTGKLASFSAMPQPNSGEVYHWGLVVNRAMGVLANNLFVTAPTASHLQIDSVENVFRQKFSPYVNEEILNRSESLGEAIAKSVFEYSKSDFGHEGYKNNFPVFNYPTNPGDWKPTPPAFQKALQPYWGKNRTFVPGITQFVRPVAPQTYSTDENSRFYAQALEVYTVGKSLTPAESAIAHYWSDDPGLPGTPPGHMVGITAGVLRTSQSNLARSAEAFCRVGLALSDAFVCCWDCKYEYNLLRPVTYIQENIDANWLPELVTPPFPEYVSGHSVQSGAWAQVMSDFFGYNYPFLDEVHKNRTDIDGAPRAFNNFFEAANQAADSRLYGGIHYRDGIVVGVEMGKLVGKKVSALNFKK
jgi:hypothetical protein